jgi:hypothetical protein
MKNNINITVLHSGSEEDIALASPIIKGLTALNAEFPDNIHIWVSEQRAAQSTYLSGLLPGSEDEKMLQDFMKKSDIVVILLSKNLSPLKNEIDFGSTKLAVDIQDIFEKIVTRREKTRPIRQNHKVFAALIQSTFIPPELNHIFGFPVPQIFWQEKPLITFDETNGERDLLVNEFVGIVRKYILESREECIRVAIPAWVGYLPGINANDGLKFNRENLLYKNEKIGVEFVIIDDFDRAVEAWKNGEVHLVWATADLLARNWETLQTWDPMVVYQSDWSCGADCLLVRENIKSIEDLKGHKLIATKNSPGEMLFRMILKNNGLNEADFLIETPDSDTNQTIKIFTKDKGKNYQGILCSVPFDQICIKNDPKLHEIFSTKNEGYDKLIADLLIANRTFYNTHSDELRVIFKTWFEETKKIKDSLGKQPELVEKSVKGLVNELLEPIPSIVPDDILDQIHRQLTGYFMESLSKIELCGLVENQHFFKNDFAKNLIVSFSEVLEKEKKHDFLEITSPEIEFIF